MIDFGLPLEHSAAWWAGIGFLGLAVGVVGGMFGVGGNFFLIPLLNIAFEVPLPVAVGTGLCQVIGSATAALVRHSRLKQGETAVGWIMMGGAVFGSQIGANALGALMRAGHVNVLSRDVSLVKLVLSLTFAAILLTVAVAMARDARNRPASEPLGPGPLTRLRIPPMITLSRSERRVSATVLAVLGLALGFLNGLVGMGGGVVLLPLLLYGVGMRLRMAAATGVVTLVASAFAGTYAHAVQGHVHLGLAMTLLAGSTLGAPVGATISSRVDGRKLRALFAALICLTAVAVLWDLVSAFLITGR